MSDRSGDIDRLDAYLKELGADDADIAAATRVGGLGPLALDLVLRPPGEVLSLEELASGSGLDVDLVRRLWLACGLPDPETAPFPFPVTPDAASAIRLLAAFCQLVGEDAALGFARVVGSSVARVAEALSGAQRVGTELPQLESGLAYSDVVRDYTNVARTMLPAMLDAVTALFRRHLVLVSYQTWSPDEERVAVTLERTVGFVDLVGSTETLLRLSVSQMAAMVEQFEQLTWDTVAEAGGRLVKLIGDEAMFVLEDAAAACRVAQRLVETSAHPVRIGLAKGPVVALRGDYYAPTVNLAARLVSAAPPSTVLVSETVRDGAPDLEFEPVDVGPLRGFPGPVPAYRLVMPN